MDIASRIVRDSRRRQSLPEQVEDSMTMDAVARLLGVSQARVPVTPPRSTQKGVVIARRGRRVIRRGFPP